MSGQRWQVKAVPLTVIRRGHVEPPEELEAALAEGWEPFAVVRADDGREIWLRLQEEE